MENEKKNNKKAIAAIAATYVLTFVLGFMVAIMLIAAGLRISIPQISYKHYDLQMEIASEDGTSPATGYGEVAGR